MVSPSLLTIFVIILGYVASATAEVPTFSNATTVKIIPIDAATDIDDFVNSAGLIPLSRSLKNKEYLRYDFGSRDYLDDKIVSQGSGLKSYNVAKNITLQFDYPSYGYGAPVSYVEIDVEQSSKEGSAYIVSGGIDERKISIMVEAQNTNWLKYSFRIYGY